MQNRQETDLGAQVPGIPGNGTQGLRTAVEEDVIDCFLVLQSDGGDLLRNGEHHVEIVGIKKIGLPIVEPRCPGKRLAFRTMPVSAAVVSEALMAARVALLEMATENGGATQFDGAHGTSLPTAKRIGMRLPVGGPKVTEDICHFE